MGGATAQEMEIGASGQPVSAIGARSDIVCLAHNVDNIASVKPVALNVFEKLEHGIPKVCQALGYNTGNPLKTIWCFLVAMGNQRVT